MTVVTALRLSIAVFTSAYNSASTVPASISTTNAKRADYRAYGRDRQKVMTLSLGEFIRRFLIHVLPHGFHRIRHYGLLASGTRADNIARLRRLLDVPTAQPEAADNSCVEATEPKPLPHPCPCCGGRMIIIETFQRGEAPCYRSAASIAVIRTDTS